MNNPYCYSHKSNSLGNEFPTNLGNLGSFIVFDEHAFSVIGWETQLESCLYRLQSFDKFETRSIF